MLAPTAAACLPAPSSFECEPCRVLTATTEVWKSRPAEERFLPASQSGEKKALLKDREILDTKW